MTLAGLHSPFSLDDDDKNIRGSRLYIYSCCRYMHVIYICLYLSTHTDTHTHTHTHTYRNILGSRLTGEKKKRQGGGTKGPLKLEGCQEHQEW